MRVILAEDDHLQAEHIRLWLREAWPDIEIETIETESEFCSRLSALSDRLPNIFIMDLILRWSDPGPNMEAPPAESQTKHNAGLRCARLLQQNPATRHIPVILYSVLERTVMREEASEFPPHVQYLEKEASPGRLIRMVGSFVASQHPTKQLSATTRDVFICHASEDKAAIVEPLVSALEESGITVWHDRAEIRWGDSLISKVEEGLRISRYVLAVLSKHSVTKPWPRRELHAALNREASTGEVKVLPLIVGSADERAAILLECALQNDKLYEVWTGSATPIVQRLKQRLK